MVKNDQDTRLKLSRRRQTAALRVAAAFARLGNDELARRRHTQLIDLLRLDAEKAADSTVGVAS